MATGYQGYGNNPQSRRKSIWFLGHEYTWNERLQEYVRWFTPSGGSAVAIKLSDEKKKFQKLTSSLKATMRKGYALSDEAKQNSQRMSQNSGRPNTNNVESNLRRRDDSSSNKKSESKSNEPEKGPEKKPESDALKQRQLALILAANPMTDSYHTGIRTIEDIKTSEEVFRDNPDEFAGCPDWTEQDAAKALKSGFITVYSSRKLKTGTFVTPSKMEAQSYAGDQKVYSKRVPLNSVAWIDSLQGEYCPDAVNLQRKEEPSKKNSKPEPKEPEKVPEPKEQKPVTKEPAHHFEGALFSVNKNNFQHEFTDDLDELAEIMKTASYFDFFSVEKEFDNWRQSYEQTLLDKEPKKASFSSEEDYLQASKAWIAKRAELILFTSDFRRTLQQSFLQKTSADPKYQPASRLWASPDLGIAFHDDQKINQKDLLQFDVETLKKSLMELERAWTLDKHLTSKSEPRLAKYFSPKNFNAAYTAYIDDIRNGDAFYKRIEQALGKAIRTHKKLALQGQQPENEPVTNFPENPESLKYVKSLGGSTGAELVEAEDGTRYVRKRGNSGGHILNECQVDDFYRAQGVRVPEFKVYDTENGPVKLSRYLEGSQTLDDWWNNADQNQREAMSAELRKGFAVDILTGNWDVVGMDADNILIDKEGKPWRIDNGGALSYRAQGAKKTKEQWGDGFVDDLWTMTGNGKRIGLDVPSNLPTYFGKVDVGEMARAIEKQDWSNALKCLSKDQRFIVKKRLGEIHQLAVREEDFFTNRYSRDYTLAILDETYKFSKKGLREACTFSCDLEKKDYGWFRSVSGSLKGKKKASRYRSISAFLRSELGDEAVDFVEGLNHDQGCDSYDGDSTRTKILRLRAQGFDLANYSAYDALYKDATAAGYYLGDPAQPNRPSEHYNNIKNAFDYYKARNDEYDLDFSVMTKYNAAIQIALENASFTNNDKATRSLILARTEAKDVITSSGAIAPGDLCKHRVGVNESHSIVNVCNVKSINPVLTMVRVPYSRINGLYMMESDFGDMFYDDDENEIVADTHGLPIYLMNDASKNGEPLSKYIHLLELFEKNK